VDKDQIIDRGGCDLVIDVKRAGKRTGDVPGPGPDLRPEAAVLFKAKEREIQEQYRNNTG
jgi:hypothetical protein